jgi:hypothetical protein
MTTITVPRAVLERALEALDGLSEDAVCQSSHHAKTDQHTSLDVCPVFLRLCVAIPALRAALAQQEQEPKAWMLTDDSGMRFVSVDRPHPDFVPLYTAPPRREWQSLSEEEINELSHTMVKGHKSVNWLTRAIEQALKEKNHD